MFRVISLASKVTTEKGYLQRMLLFYLQLLACGSNLKHCFLIFLIDYEKVLELDANNFEAKNELKKIDQVIRLVRPNIH